MRTTDTNAVVEAMKASPPVAVSGMHYWGISLSDLVLVATFIYTILQIYFLLRDKLGQRKRKPKDGS